MTENHFDRVVENVAEKHDLSQERATAIVETAFDEIRNVVEQGPIRIPRFGTFKMYHQEEREYENPQTGEDVHVPARQKFAFEGAEKVHEELKEIGQK